MRPFILMRGAACCLGIGGCADTLDRAYGSGFFALSGGPDCMSPPFSLRRSEVEYRDMLKRNRPDCMAVMLSRDLRNIFTRDSEPWMFCVWLAAYGFRRAANRKVDLDEYDCRVRRTSRTFGILFGGAPPEKHVWQILYRDFHRCSQA
jgi:hypothetical protein